jgi:hypothetical protein
VSRRDKPSAELDRVCAIGFLIIVLSVSALLLLGHKQVLTGDETRYLMYAYSIAENGRFVMTLPEWQSLYLSATHTPTSELPTGGGGVVLMNGIYLPTVLAPVARAFALAGLRAATLIAGLIGLLYLLRLCRRCASPDASLLATGVAAFCIHSCLTCTCSTWRHSFSPWYAASGSDCKRRIVIRR